MATPLMNLDLPVVGVGGTAGPDWADKLNTALEVVDEHDHSSGKGTPVKTAGLSIDANLTFGGYSATTLRSTRFSSQASVFASSADNNSVYVKSGELYFKDNTGNNVQLTSGGAINISSIGAITGDYSTSSADLNYSDSTKTFLFLQSAGVTANVAHGPLLIYKNSASSNYSKFSIPAAQSSNLDFEWVSAYPAAKYPLFMSTGGAITSEAAAIIDAHISSSAGIARTKLAYETLQSKTGAYTLVNSDDTILGDCTSAGFTLTLPTAVGITGKKFTIKKIAESTNTLTIATTSSQTIDGATSFAIRSKENFIVVQSDGANWVVVAKNVNDYYSSVNVGPVSTTATGVWKDITSITLPAGTWEISAGVVVAESGASITRLYCGIGTVSGDSGTDMNFTESLFEMPHPTSTRDVGFSIPTYRRTITSSTTYYLKIRGTYVTSDIDGYGSIMARRVG